MKRTHTPILIGAICLFMITIFVAGSQGYAVVEGTYTETDTNIARDSRGAPLNWDSSSHRDIPDDRKMKSIVTNVVKAEERDEYISRSLNQIREDVEKRLSQFDVKLAKLEGQISAVKTMLIKSGAVKRGNSNSAMLASTETPTATARETGTTIV